MKKFHVCDACNHEREEKMFYNYQFKNRDTTCKVCIEKSVSEHKEWLKTAEEWELV